MRFMILVLVTTMSATAVGQQQSNDAAGTTVRVAAVSFLPQKFDLAGNADRLESARGEQGRRENRSRSGRSVRWIRRERDHRQ